MSSEQLTLQDLAQTVGVPERTIRYYIAEGLLPAPTGRGKAAFYTDEHLLRLRLVRKLSQRRVPLAEQRVHELPLEQVRELLDQEEQVEADRQRGQAAVSPKEYIAGLLREARAGQQPPPPLASPREANASLPPALAFGAGAEAWWRWELAPGIELHIRAEDGDRNRKFIERLLRVAANRAKPRGGTQLQEDMA